MKSAARVARTATTALALAGAAWYALAYLYVALRRFGYPYELEWLEGGVLDEVRRVIDGKQLYTQPALRAVPYLYTPLYVWVSAAVSKVVGIGFPAMRATSIVASVVACWALFRLVQRDTSSDLVAAALAVGIFLATFEISGSWLDLARVDTLFLALLLVGLVLARDARTPVRAAISAIVLVAAIFTKQSALLPAVAVVPFLFTYGKRVVMTFVATFGVVLLAAVAIMQLTTDGWFLFYVRTVPGGHAIAREFATAFWTEDLLGNVWPAIVLTVVGVVALITVRRTSRALWFHLPVLLGMLASAYSARLHTGGYVNVLLPAYAAIAIMAGLGIAASRRSPRPWFAVAAMTLVIVQLVHLWWSPADQLPRAGDVAAGRRLISELRALPGPIYLPGQPYLLGRAGRADDAGAQSAAIADVLRANTGVDSERLAAELETAIRDQRFCSVVVDRPIELSYLPDDFTTYYAPGRVLLVGREMEPVTGTIAVPWQVYTPRGGAAARCQRT